MIEMSGLSFFMPMEPPTVTLQAKQINTRTGKVFDSAAVRDAKAKLESYVSKYSCNLITEPYTRPCRLTAYFLYPPRGRHKAKEPYTQKPDWDNATKLLQDCLATCGLIKDDKLIVEAHVAQMYDMPCGIYVKLEEI